MNATYEQLKDFNALYLNAGAYHKNAQGFKAWFLTDNYLAIASFCESTHTVLDLACGEGCLAAFLNVQRLVGVDHSPEALNLNRKLYPQAYEQLILADLRHLDSADLPEAHFDRVLCSLSLMYLIGNDLESALHGIYRVLKPGGSFVFTYPSVSRLRPANPSAAELSAAALKTHLQTAGFKSIAMTPFCPLLPQALYDQSMRADTQAHAKKAYEEGKRHMTLDHCYHFVCHAKPTR